MLRARSISSLARPGPIFILLVLAGLGAQGCAPTLKQNPVSPVDIEREAEKQKDVAFETWVKRQERLDQVSWRIARASVELCPEHRPAVGLWLHNLAAYSGDFHGSAARYFKLGDAITVRSATPGMPAAEAGLARGDTILSINGTSVAGKPLPKVIEMLLDAGTGKDSVRIRYLRAGEARTATMLPASICNYPAVVTQDDIVNAYADGQKIYIASGMMRFTENDEELALVVGHEMAHDALHHVQKRTANSLLGTLLDIAVIVGTGVDTQGVFTSAAGMVYSKAFESEADYQGLYMAARAGYEIKDAAQFWRRMAAENPGSIKQNFTASHPSTPERFLSLENAVKEIEAKRQAGQPLVPERQNPGKKR